jgi:urease accessory protein
MTHSTHALSATTLMKLMWLGSPALPVGGFSYSEGLEIAVEEGFVHDESSALGWLTDQMHLSQARGDWPLVAQATLRWIDFDPSKDPQGLSLTTLNTWVIMTRESAEFRLQTLQMGYSLLNWLKATGEPPDPRVQWCHELTDPTWPIVYALALALTETDLTLGLTSHAFGWAENMVQTAMKTIPLGQLAGQRLLNVLIKEIPQAVHFALQQTEFNRQIFTPGLAILSAQHEEQYSRLFRS